MSKTKKWSIIALILLGAGALACLAALALVDFDLKRLSTVNYVTQAYDIESDFQNINIDADIERIVFASSDSDKCRVVCYEEEKNPHSVRTDGDTLVIGRADNKWRVDFGIFMSTPEITVYLPQKSYSALYVDGDTSDVEIPASASFDNIQVKLDTGDISCLASVSGDILIETDTGAITISGISANEIKLGSDTGKIKISDVEVSGNIDITENTGRVDLKNISCRSLISKGYTGKLTMAGVIAAEKFELERDTGNIVFDSCDAGEIYVKTDTGSVTGTLLTDKVFIIDTDTGSVNVPKSITGGRCEITTDTGNIRIDID